MKHMKCKRILSILNTIKTWTEKLLNPRNGSSIRNISIIILGLAATFISIKLYLDVYVNFDLIHILENIDRLFLMSVYAIFSSVGIVMIISCLNCNNCFVKIVLIIFSLIALFALFTVRFARIAFILIIFSLVSFFIMKSLSKIFVTFISLSILSTVSLLVFYMFIKTFTQIMFLPGLYICFSTMLLLYNIFGVKINQWLLFHIFGCCPNEIQQYDYNQLKNQINLIYLILFVAFNVSALLYSNNTEVLLIINCINNALLTGVGITNVNWKSMLMKK